MIKKLKGGKYVLMTHDGKKRLSHPGSRQAALKRERQVQYFKHRKGK